MFADNKEFANMFTEEKPMNQDNDLWKGTSFICVNEESFNKFINSEDENDLGYESTGMCLSKEKALSSYCEDLKPESHEEASSDIMESNEMSSIRNMIDSQATDLNCFLDSHVFFDLEVDCEIQPLGEVTLSTNKRKIRKSPAQIKILKQAYEYNDEWNRDLIDSLANQAGLSFKQVYKWYASERTAHQKRLPKGCSKKATRF